MPRMHRTAGVRDRRPAPDAGFATSVTPYRDPYLRIGPSIVTLPDEVDGLVSAISEIVAG